jgi:hypothetical protein
MTPEQARRGAEMFAAGSTEREVADELGCSPSSAHRLRERLADDRETRETAVSDQDGHQDDATAVASAEDEVDAAGRRETLLQLGEMREDAAGQLADLEARAAASRGALAALDAERVKLLFEGKDAAQLRPRMQSARDDLADWETSAGFARQNIAAIDQRIAEVQAVEQLAEMRVQLAAAVAERDAELARTGARMRAAVTAVHDAADEFVNALADEQAVTDRVERLEQAVASAAVHLGQSAPVVAPPEGTGLWIEPTTNGPGLALLQAVNAARVGHVQLVAERLGTAFGYLPPTREENAANLEEMLRRRAEQDRVMRAGAQGEPWTRGDTSSYDVDQNGREIRYNPGHRPPVAPHPRDAYLGFTPRTGY